MKKIKRLLVLIALAIAFLALIAAGYLAYNQLINKTEALKTDLKNKNWELEAIENKLSKANQKNISFSAEKEGLNKKIAVQKEQITGIVKAKEELEKQQEALSTSKQELEKALKEAERLYQEQISLRKLDAEAIEESFKKKTRQKWIEFFAGKKKLEKQVKNFEAKMKEVLQENQVLQTRLKESDQVILEFKLRRRAEGDPLKPLSQEGERFRKEVLKFHYNKAFAYDQSGEYEKAVVEYRNALAVAPDDADIYYNLAILYDEYLFDKRKAIEHYQAYLKLRPDGEDASKVNYWIVEAKKDLEWDERKLKDEKIKVKTSRVRH